MWACSRKNTIHMQTAGRKLSAGVFTSRPHRNGFETCTISAPRNGVAPARPNNHEAIPCPFKVQVGPPQIAIHQGQTVLVSEPDGQINWPSDKGLYFLDTRIVSSWAIYANGEPWELLNGRALSTITPHVSSSPTSPSLRRTARFFRATLGLTIGRSISGGLHEDLEHHQQQHEAGAVSARDRLPLRLRRHLEVKYGPHRAPRPDHHGVVGGAATGPYCVFEPGFPPCRDNVCFVCALQRLSRQWATQLRRCASAERGLARLLALRARGWRPTFPRAARLHRTESQVPATPRRWRSGWRPWSGLRPATKNSTGCSAKRCGGHGRAPSADQGHRPRGFPACCRTTLVVAPFGRDSLIVSLQNILIYPEFARGALEILGALQAKEEESLPRCRARKDFYTNCAMASLPTSS